MLMFGFGFTEPYISNPIIVCVSEHLYPANNFLETIRTIHDMCLQESNLWVYPSGFCRVLIAFNTLKFWAVVIS